MEIRYDYLVSIIVPIYNKEKLLSRCILSILNQDYKNFELLLVDDGSTDHSISVCKEYAKKDNRVKVFSKQNGGVSSARNFGIEKANGDFLLFVDSDDYIDQKLVSTFLDNYEENTLSICSFKNLFPKSVTDCILDDCSSSLKLLLKNYCSVKNINAIICSVCNKFYNLTLIRDYNIRFDERTSFGEDFIFNCEYFKRCSNVKCLSDTLYYYDNSVKNSGVKTVYLNFDFIIGLMHKNLIELIHFHKYEDFAIDFANNFILKTWNYAFSSCIEKYRSRRASFIIYNWRNNVPIEIKRKSLDTQNSLHFLYCECSRIKLEKQIRKYKIRKINSNFKVFLYRIFKK